MVRLSLGRAVSTVPLALFATLWIPTSVAQGVSVSPEIDFETTPTEPPNTYYAILHPCPAACQGGPPSNWTVYSEVDRLTFCNEPILFDTALYNPLDDPNTPVKLRACTTAAGNPDTEVNSLFVEARPEEELTKSTKSKRQEESPKCVSGSESKSNVQIVRQGSRKGNLDDAITTLLQLDQFFGQKANCHASILFSYSNQTVVGIYVGQSFGKATVKSSIASLITDVKANGLASQVSLQLCGPERNAHHVFGIAIDTTGDLAAVQKSLLAWDKAKCSSEGSTSKAEVTVWEAGELNLGNALANATIGNSTALSRDTARVSKHKQLHNKHRSLNPRADCRTTSVIDGDGCGALAVRCGISAADFTKYNPDSKLCSTLAAGQRVCCSSGTLPDVRPQPGSDGTCSTHYVIAGDNCSKLAAANGLKIIDIETYNNGTSGTWGWTGCANLMVGVNICLSKGNPPMPAPVANAVCGPTKTGSVSPGAGKNLTDMNPCPLKVCCNIWGQCGINADFCTLKRGPSGNPGTSPPKTNGCVSNCGMDIVNNKESPGPFGRVGYYEAWNFNRPCLNLRSENANTDGSYTIMHWAFAEVNPDWSVKIVDKHNQWAGFKKLTNVKKIISFGGWGYSTEPGTYDVLRQGMMPANRDTFASKVAAFVSKEGLDGVDFDWEYPGAIDIPGTPPGFESDGPNYLKFLTTIRGKMATGPRGKTLSIAAPASYWYLKAFPIEAMAKQLDYIVYMTYDLHGQWDAGNKWAIDGCEAGNCLRSHINLTETTTALSMITKAGVPSYKIYVGESSYGRSFKMAQAGCDGPMCTFTGDRLNSDAMPGACTDTSGYISNAEIEDIKRTYKGAKSWHDARSNSDLLVYAGTEWVAYMTKTTKDTRRTHWKGLNFAGTIDWAVDLQSFTDDDALGPDGDGEGGDGGDVEPPWPATEKCTGTYDTLEAIEGALSGMTRYCRAQYILQALQKILSSSLSEYDQLVKDGYDSRFKTYADAVVGGASDQVEKFMYGKGDDYFTCIVTETVDCCSFCEHYWGPSDRDVNCRYCEDFDCGWGGNICDNPEVNCPEVETRYKNMTTACPPDYSKRGQSPPATPYWSQSVYWTMKPDKVNQFWADLYTETGITQEDIEWKNINHYACSPNDKHCRDRNWDYNFPVPKGYTREDVLNPKDVVSNAHNNLKGLTPQVSDLLARLKAGTFQGVSDDTVDALTLPVFMVEDAVKNMGKIRDIANKIDAEKRKMIILAFLSAIFFFVPFVGEIVGGIAALANIGRIIALVGAAGNVALDIYSIVDSKDNLPLLILGIVLAPLSLLDVASIAKAANFRRGMPLADVKKLGPGPNARMDTVTRIKGMCPRPLKARDFPFGGLPMSSLSGEAMMSHDYY